MTSTIFVTTAGCFCCTVKCRFCDIYAADKPFNREKKPHCLVPKLQFLYIYGADIYNELKTKMEHIKFPQNILKGSMSCVNRYMSIARCIVMTSQLRSVFVLPNGQVVHFCHHLTSQILVKLQINSTNILFFKFGKTGALITGLNYPQLSLFCCNPPSPLTSLYFLNIRTSSPQLCVFTQCHAKMHLIH